MVLVWIILILELGLSKGVPLSPYVLYCWGAHDLAVFGCYGLYTRHILLVPQQ